MRERKIKTLSLNPVIRNRSKYSVNGSGGYKKHYKRYVCNDCNKHYVYYKSKFYHICYAAPQKKGSCASQGPFNYYARENDL